MTQKHLESFGEPVINVGALSVWVHGYAFPLATDGWHGNWLTVTARCIGEGASIIVTGTLLDTVSFHRLRSELAMVERREGSATLKSHEPYLAVTFAPGETGHIDVEIKITPDDVRQRHHFFETIDPSQLAVIRNACDAVLSQCPIRDPQSRGDLDGQ